MHRPIPGARFFASVLAGASLFGGATALADAGRLGVTHIDVPVSAVAPDAPAALSDGEAKAADAVVKEAEKAAAAALAAAAPQQEAEEPLAGQGLPRLRPEPTAQDDAEHLDNAG